VTRRRSTELGLLLLVVLITGGAYVLVGLGEEASLPADIGPFLLLVLGLLLGGHLAIRRFAPQADGILLPVAALLNGIGYVFIARLDEDLAANQATWTLLGIGVFIATLALVRDASDLARYRWTFVFVGIGLLLLPLLPGIGLTINGARLWIEAGPVNFQPGELAKIALTIFLAAYLVENREVLSMGSHRLGPLQVPDLRHLAPVVLAWAASLVVMIAERDLGSSLLLFATFIVMLWVATSRIAYVIAGALLFAVGAMISWSLFDHVKLRVDIWLDPWQDPFGDGFQLVQSTFGMAGGGLFGTGPGQGRPDLIPLPETDFIFAAITEELGLLGGTALLAAYLLILGTGLRTAVRSTDPFNTLLATGLTFVVGFQAFVIIGGVLRLVPLTGITLPFVSYGGSSLLANYVLLALLLRLSDQVNQRSDAAGAPALGGDAGLGQRMPVP
jgi:cell division protein FtsW (lipid II flippase)